MIFDAPIPIPSRKTTSGLKNNFLSYLLIIILLGVIFFMGGQGRECTKGQMI